MTNSPTSSVPNTTSRVNHFTGLARKRRRFSLLPANGDGSTLSLDFTTGVLDPRLTFTRTTNATFINSSGLVEWAAANMFRNTGWGSTSLPTGWLANGSNTGTVTYNGNGTITCAATSQIAWIYPDFPYVVTQTGLSYICSFRVVSISGPTLITDILSTGNFTASDYFINGVSVGASPSAPSGNVTGPCVVSVRVNATSTSWFPRLGVGVQGLNRTATITMSEPHAHPGTVPVPYLANTSTSASNHNTPRFDHDPTAIGTPRGLLIEGSASNLTKYSEDLSQVSGINQWYGTNMNTPTVPGGAPNSPYGTTAASWKLVATAGAAFHVWRNAVAFTAADYTFSFWAKAAEYDRIVLSDVGTGRGACSFVLTGNGTATAISGGVTPTNPTIVKHDNGWYRCSVTMTMTAATYGMGIVGYPAATTPTAFGASYTADGTSGVYATMFQTELGSGASSYIPSGVSTGNRAADNCYTTISNVNGFNANQGTAFVAWRDNTASDTTVVQEWAFAFGLTLASGYGVFMPNQTTAFPIQGGVSNAGDASSANLVIGGINKAAIGTIVTAAPNTGTCRLSANGASVTTGTNISGYNAAQTLSFGQRNNNLRYLNGWIQQFKYWPSVLPDAQLQALTT